MKNFFHTCVFIFYINATYINTSTMVAEDTKLGLIVELSEILGIGATGKKILEALVKSGEKLSVSEMADIIKRSERSIREHIRHLTKLGLIGKEIFVTKNGRLAYRYSVLMEEDLIKSARNEVLKRLRKLEQHADKLTR